MGKIKNWFNTWLSWGKKHIFHFVVSIIIGILSVGLTVQCIMLRNVDKESRNRGIAAAAELRDAERKFYHGLAETKNEIEMTIARTKDELKAEIEIIDSTINKDAKHKALIVKIREAISASTNRKIGAEKLTMMANAAIKASYEWNFPISQILAQMKVESDFNVAAISHAKAQGPMQIIPTTQAYIQVHMRDAPRKFNPFNPYHAVRGGCFYLDEQIKEFGSLEIALQAYNWGPHRMRDFNAGLGDPMPQETKDYPILIFKHMEFFERYGLDE